MLEPSCSKNSETSRKMDSNDVQKFTRMEMRNEDESTNDQSMLDIEEELKKLDGGSDVNLVKAVEIELLNDQQLNEEKNHTKTPECSKANESSLSVNPASIKSLANGSLPKSGKPMMLTLEKNTKKKVTKPRGRPKQKAFVAMYQSQIKDNNLGIKLCIKKSDLSSNKEKKSSSVESKVKSKPARKRSRKSKQTQNSDSEASDYEKRRKRDGKAKSNNNTEKESEPKQLQSLFAERLPQHVLHRVSIPSFECCKFMERKTNILAF